MESRQPVDPEQTVRVIMLIALVVVSSMLASRILFWTICRKRITFIWPIRPTNRIKVCMVLLSTISILTVVSVYILSLKVFYMV